MKVSISVAMATYNGDKFLREQLDSIYSQTVVPDEVIVCDDCSTDRTHQILEEYHKSHGLKYYINKVNLGVNKNFEKALRLCTSDYIAISDQDDVWLPNKIEISLNKVRQIEGEEYACVSSQAYYVDANLENIGRPGNISEYTSGAYYTYFYHVSQGSSLFFNRKLLLVLNEFPENMYYDFYIGMVAASIGKKYNLSEKLMYYRVHGNNVTARIVGNKEVKENFLDKMRNLVIRYKYYNVLSKNRIDLLCQIQKEYSNLLTQEAASLLSGLKLYQSKSVWKRITAISIIYNNRPTLAIKKAFIELIASCIHLENTSKMF